MLEQKDNSECSANVNDDIKVQESGAPLDKMEIADCEGVMATEIPTQQAIENALSETTKKIEGELKALQELLLREKAENENLRKRFTKELEEAHKYAVNNFAKDLIEVLENMYRATENISPSTTEEHPAVKNIVDGVELTKNSLIAVFGKYGITRFYPLHQPFDHNMHQAILQVNTNEQPEGSIVQVIRAGYTLKERLLSPALVAIAKPL